MKKLIVIVLIIVFMGVMISMLSPPGDGILDDYSDIMVNSKDRFRQRKDLVDGEFLNSGVIGSVNNNNNTVGVSGDFVEIPVPDDLSKDSLRLWLNQLSLSPERRAIVSFEIERMGTIPYVYGGDGRTKYRQEPETWSKGTDCSGLVTSALYRGGIDYGFCFNTGSLYSTFAGNQVQGVMMPGDISVVSGSHTELYLGKQADGTWIHIGVRGSNDPPGPSAIRNHGTLVSSAAIHVRPPQLQEADDRYYASAGNSNQNIVGNWGNASQYIASEQTGEVNALLPEVEVLMNDFVKKCNEAGLNIKVTETVRSVARQEELYAQGRTTAGSIVTNARGTTFGSYHQWGLAFDFCQNVRGNAFPPGDDVFWQKCGDIGKSLGLEWGGDWTSFKDRPHMQLSKYGGRVSELKSKYGTPAALFKDVLGE